MKKKLLIPILLTTASLPLVAITSCNKQIHPTNITLNKTSLSLEQGTTFELKATLEPESVAYQLEWSSTSRDVATVNNGVITAKQPGLTTITVKVVGFADVQTTCTVRVVEPLKCFTVTALENSTLVTYGNGPYSYPSNLSYSTDGIVWTQLELKVRYGDPIVIKKGESIQLKGLNLKLGMRATKLLFTGKVSLSGSLMSLIDNGAHTTDIPCSECFDSLFHVPSASEFDTYHYSIVSAENLLLPDIDLTGANDCYGWMFTGCFGLECGPRLYATTLAEGCYYSMFAGCQSLEQIKLDYTGNFDSNYFGFWVDGVPQTDGTIYYNGEDTNNFGNSAIPGTSDSHWDVQTFEDM